MGRQVGTKDVGTVGPVTFYKMMGEYFLRARSSINTARIEADPAYEAFRQNGKLHGLAAKIACAIYRTWPVEEKIHPRFGYLTAEIKRLLQHGLNTEQVVASWNDYASTEPSFASAIVTTPIKITTSKTRKRPGKRK